MTDHDDASRDSAPSGDLHEVVKEVTESHGDQGADAMAEQLRDRVAETRTADEDEGDRQN